MVHLTSECPVLFWPTSSAISVAVALVRRASVCWWISPNFSCFCFLFWRTVSRLLLWAHLHHRCRAINLALHPLTSCDTNNNSTTNHVSSQQTLNQDQGNSQPFHHLWLERTFNFLFYFFYKGQPIPSTNTSGDVSISFYGSLLGQEWELYIGAGLNY